MKSIQSVLVLLKNRELIAWLPDFQCSKLMVSFFSVHGLWGIWMSFYFKIVCKFLSSINVSQQCCQIFNIFPLIQKYNFLTNLILKSIKFTPFNSSTRTCVPGPWTCWSLCESWRHHGISDTWKESSDGRRATCGGSSKYSRQDKWGYLFTCPHGPPWREGPEGRHEATHTHTHNSWPFCFLPAFRSGRGVGVLAEKGTRAFCIRKHCSLVKTGFFVCLV